MIIGQGLAGSCLALELRKRGKRILVFDRVDPHSASRVAAGMYNPITSKVRSLTWNAGVLFPLLEKFYAEAERLTGSNFFQPLPMYRPFPSQTDQQGWGQVENDYLETVYEQSEYGSFVRDPFGGLRLKHAGFVDTNEFIRAVKKILEADRCLIEDNFPEQVNDRFIESCKNLADRVVFCEGVRVTENPLFRWLPISHLKGEVLDVQTELPKDILFNRSVYLVPSGSGFRAGSTYERTSAPGNSNGGVNDIESRLRNLLVNPFRITGQSWGFRPAVRDRRPVLGEHPDQKGIFVFNGLGTKGVSLAPWSAASLANWMEGSASLPDEVNISRFYPLYFKYLQDSQ